MPSIQPIDKVAKEAAFLSVGCESEMPESQIGVRLEPKDCKFL
jgi:hypothetical protein